MTHLQTTLSAMKQAALVWMLISGVQAQAYAHSDKANEGISRLFIGADKTKEVCLELKKGESISYRFEASDPLAFNIHYHEGDILKYPIKRDSTRAMDTELSAEIAQTYCLMWTNRGQDPVDLELRLHKAATH